MRKETRQALDAYFAQLATINEVASVVQKFNVVPRVQQTLESKMQESSAFLQRINIVGVTEQMGAKIGIGVNGPVAGRTDTTGNGTRKPRNVTAMDDKGYLCVQTNSDTAIRYAQLDAWAGFPNFQTLVRDAIIRRQALDRICIGFNGTSIAANTDLAANPMLQDVNKGWLQQMRENAAANVVTQGDKQPGKVIVGPVAATSDYANLDAVVYDAITLLDPWNQEDPDLVAVLGRGLMHDKYFPLVNKDQPPSEALAADIVISQKRVGGLQAVTVPFFPAGKVLVTTLANLSLYWQRDARRRNIKDVPERDQIENYESSNDAYVVEDYGRAALVENIELVA
ncbi:phage major capsid protein, P2 family [Variovorax boronicumulans]|uniref:Phage major capsid protein, P2 family n=1 Tax=Variovorax boronicumulans TaxID=436515 RepID=A0A250DSE1_9BURK|nr:phage major capsid protein, P2 family [Variovorax boronicumulans]ATA57204.1 phage major capsid protein, P2 family [Variovorax boronicumulans]